MTKRFKTVFAENIFRQKYAQGPSDSWDSLADRLVNDVCGDRSLCAKPNTSPIMSKEDQAQLAEYIKLMYFIPGGRYLYYAGRPISFYNNCFALIGQEDTREEWGNFVKKASDALMSGGGIGGEYSVFRAKGKPLARTGGTSSGPIPLMCSTNEIGRNVMQGGSRRSAIYAGLNWSHGDAHDFIRVKDYPEHLRLLKEQDLNFPLPLDMTNISIGWDTKFAVMNGSTTLSPQLNSNNLPDIWYDSVRRMCKTGEPGHAYNFWENEKDIGRNACGEFTSEDDSDVCNLGSVNFGAIPDINTLRDVCNLASKFLVCGSIRGDLPYDKVREVREQNRKVGLGVMGVHEWLLKRGLCYGMCVELAAWFNCYMMESMYGANEWSDRFFINRPKKYRSIAPAGTIGILASTTTGIEPLYAVAYKRRYLSQGSDWKYQYVIDGTAQRLIDDYGVDPYTIESAYDLAKTPERRIAFQADVQKYVDMGISSTLNLEAWGTEFNNEDTCKDLAHILAKYCHGLRGMTAYPDGSRGGQPLTVVDYDFAKNQEGMVYDEVEDRCSGSVCGI